MEDREQNVTGLGAELRLELSGREHLIDFSAGDYVYATLREGQRTVLDAKPTSDDAVEPAWQILHGKEGSLEPFVVGTRETSSPAIGGWMHVMDQSRCSAIAFGQFAQSTHDRIEVDYTGRVSLHRDYSNHRDVNADKTLEFWVHFVGMPVHVGARTSPQAMRSPLHVRWLGASD